MCVRFKFPPLSLSFSLSFSLSLSQVWLPAPRGKGLEITGTFLRRGGQIYADMTFTNKAMDVMSNFAIQFNKNRSVYYNVYCWYIPELSLSLSLSLSCTHTLQFWPGSRRSSDSQLTSDAQRHSHHSPPSHPRRTRHEDEPSHSAAGGCQEQCGCVLLQCRCANACAVY